MYILHIETSTEICSVALSHGDELIECIDINENMNHTAILAPAIQRLFKSSGIRPSDLGAISVSSGPGSYTGLRVGSSTSKAMAYSLKIPLVAVPTLSALAAAAFLQYPDATWAMPMLDARRNEVFTSIYNKDLYQHIPVSSVILEHQLLKELIPDRTIVVCCGNGAHKLPEMGLSLPGIIVDRHIQSSARHLVGIAFKLVSTQDYSDPMHFVPYYLKPPNITQQKKLL